MIPIPPPASPPTYLPRGPDRRKNPTRRLSVYSLARGRRATVRRSEEAEGAFVDVYGTRLFAILMWVALMNVADSFFTLLHLQSGGSEMNPVADLLLLAGRTEFVVLKSVLIGIALLVLCIHKNFSLARLGLWVAAAAYTLLFAYHLLLFGV